MTMTMANTMSAASDRFRRYLSRRKSPDAASSSSSSTAASAAGAGHGGTSSSTSNSSSRAARRAANNRNNNGRNSSNNNGRRRLRRGWWPESQLRAERGVRAMEELAEYTFVVNEEDMEWAFPGEEGGDGEPLLEPRCVIILPESTSSPRSSRCSGKCAASQMRDRTSAECAICMTDYDVGDVVTRSPHCPHAFHQGCVIDWLSRENVGCPSCRMDFWEDGGGKKEKDGGGEVYDGGEGIANDPTADSNNDANAEEGNADGNVLQRRGRSGTMVTEAESDGDGSQGDASFDDAAEEEVVDGGDVEEAAAAQV